MQSVFQSTLQTPDRRMSLDPVYSIILCSQLESAKPACGELPWISRLSSTSTLSVPSSLSSTSSTPFQPPPPASLLNESKPNYDSAHNHENISTNHCVQHVTENLQYSKLISTRKHFVSRITKSSSRRGFLICSLCNLEIWGPNGRYHIEKCAVVSKARKTAKLAKKHNINVDGALISPDVFKKPKKPTAKPAKIHGFVMSTSVSMHDPTYAPTIQDIDNGISVGKKGWVRCLVCNQEVFAPNAKYHASICHWQRPEYTNSPSSNAS